MDLDLYTNALVHVNERRDGTVFANGDHVAWPSAFADGLIVSDDFDSLYALAFERALGVVPRYAQESFGLDDCRAMTSGVNFLGRLGRGVGCGRACGAAVLTAGCRALPWALLYQQSEKRVCVL